MNTNRMKKLAALRGSQQDDTGAALQQLALLYNLGQSQQMDPERVRGAQLENESRAMANKYYGPEQDLRLASGTEALRGTRLQNDYLPTEQEQKTRAMEEQIATAPVERQGLQIHNTGQQHLQDIGAPEAEVNYREAATEALPVDTMARFYGVANAPGNTMPQNVISPYVDAHFPQVGAANASAEHAKALEAYLQMQQNIQAQGENFDTSQIPHAQALGLSPDEISRLQGLGPRKTPSRRETLGNSMNLYNSAMTYGLH